jgi:hypothetical protein
MEQAARIRLRSEAMADRSAFAALSPSPGYGETSRRGGRAIFENLNRLNVTALRREIVKTLKRYNGKSLHRDIATKGPEFTLFPVSTA